MTAQVGFDSDQTGSTLEIVAILFLYVTSMEAFHSEEITLVP